MLKSLIERKLEQYEYKNPSYALIERDKRVNIDSNNSSRYRGSGEKWSSVAGKKDQVTLLFTGDLLCQENLINSFKSVDGGYDFTLCFDYLKPLFESADFVAGNLETPISETAPYRGEILTHEGPFYCNAPIEYMDALKYAGFDMLTTANNHTIDAGVRGLLETIYNAQDYNFIQTGTFTEKGKKFVIVDICGFKVGFTAFSTSYNSMQKNMKPEGRIALLNTYTRKRAESVYEAMKKAGAEFTVAFPHWGKEFEEEISPKQNEMAQEMVDIGYDVIAGSHSHLVQKFDYVDGKPVAFSMGNILTHMNHAADLMDTQYPVIMKVVLKRNGKQIETAVDFIPCRIIKDVENVPFAIVPCNSNLTYSAPVNNRMTKVPEIIKNLLAAEDDVIDTDFQLTESAVADFNSVMEKRADRIARIAVIDESVKSSAYESSNEEKYTIDGENVTITAFNAKATVVRMKKQYEGKTVTAIESKSKGNDKIRILYLPRHVKRVGEDAFREYVSLESVRMFNDLEVIESRAFKDSVKITGLILPESVTTLGSEAFAGCINLRSIKIPPAVTSIEKDTFEGCKYLTIYCEEGSYAETYAKENDIEVKYMPLVDNKNTAKKAVKNSVKETVNLDAYLNVNIDGLDESAYEKYTLEEPLMVKVYDDKQKDLSRFTEENGIYVNKDALETNEATLLCTGQIGYDADLGNIAKCGENYTFYQNFKHVKKCLERGDFVIGNFTSNVCEEYLSTEMMKSKYNPNKYYSNARVEYLDALKYAGFDCLAIANPNNLDTGVNGINKTNKNIEAAGMTAVGAGIGKNKIFNVNGIRVGVLSYTLDCDNIGKMISLEGASALLNVYSPARAQQDIKALKENGAEFVLVYVNCGSEKGKVNLAARKKTGVEIAEAGADYIICTAPKLISKYYQHKTKDGRIVPVATSLGDFMSGKVDKENNLAVAIRITVYKLADGTIKIDDDAIPFKQFDYLDGCNKPIVPAIKAFYSGYTVKQFPNVKTSIAKKLGSDIKIADDKKVKIDEYNQPQLTFAEIYEIFGAKPSRRDKKALKLNEKATMIATRKGDLKKGCVALLVPHLSYKRDYFEISMEDAIKAGASLIVSAKPTKKVPCIVPAGFTGDEKVDNRRWKDFIMQIYSKIVATYNPITVAITGTAGKTTTKELTSCVFDTHYNTLHVEGNNNTFYTCGSTLMKLTKKHQAYIQEAHGASPNSAKDISNMIRPDIAIITNIGDGHLKDMGTIEKVIEGKLEIATGIKDTGVLIVNNDNEYMKDLVMEGKRIIHYSLYDTNCEYYAQNIEDMGDKVKFQAVCEAGTFDLVLNMQGLHNVSNALAVFAAGIEAKIPPYKIAAGLTHYIPDSDKQNLMNFKGYNMIVDTYSATPMSVETAMQTLSAYPVAEGVKKIAVLGDIPALGTQSEEKHIEVGNKICHYDFDLMLCVGKDSRHFATAAQKLGKEAYSYEDREAFNRKLAESIKPGDFILFKSGTRSHLKEETIYPLFGLIDKQ